MIKEHEPYNYVKIFWLNEFLIGHNGFIAGGCFKNIFNDEKVKDVDVFFRNIIDHAMACKYFDKKKDLYVPYYKSKKVTAYKHIKTGVTVELVSSIYGEPEEILSQFDFTITKFAYASRQVETGSMIDDEDPFSDPETETEYFVLFDEKFFEHLHAKRLVIDDKCPFPVSTFDRMFRYGKYGYMPCKDTKLKIIEELRNVTNTDGLSDSLYDGVD